MTVLRSAALVRSVRGAKGGYVLAKAPEEIHLSEVFHALEGTVATSECVDKTEFPKRATDRATKQVWNQVEEAINKVLDEVVLLELIEQAETMR